MKKLLFILLMLFCAVSCKTTKEIPYGITENMHTVVNGIYTKHEVDSILLIDSISNDFAHDWIGAMFKEFESGKRVLKYTFLKEDENSHTVSIYTIYGYDSVDQYNLIKRVAK